MPAMRNSSRAPLRPRSLILSKRSVVFRVSIRRSTQAAIAGFSVIASPGHAVLDLHVDGDFEQPVLVFAKLPGDTADRFDVMDFVDVHCQAA